MRSRLLCAAVLCLGLAAAPGTDPSSANPVAETAYTYDPPSWFRDGKKLIIRRGGRCVPKTSQQHNPDLGETLVTQSEDCTHRIPRAVAKEFGQNPARGELCSGFASEITPEQKPGSYWGAPGYEYVCRVFARPGTNAKPNRASWPCKRSAIHDDDGGSLIDKRWIAEKTRLYRRQTFTSLRECLNPRLRRRR